MLASWRAAVGGLRLLFWKGCARAIRAWRRKVAGVSGLQRQNWEVVLEQLGELKF